MISKILNENVYVISDISASHLQENGTYIGGKKCFVFSSTFIIHKRNISLNFTKKKSSDTLKMYLVLTQ